MSCFSLDSEPETHYGPSAAVSDVVLRLCGGERDHLPRFGGIRGFRGVYLLCSRLWCVMAFCHPQQPRTISLYVVTEAQSMRSNLKANDYIAEHFPIVIGASFPACCSAGLVVTEVFTFAVIALVRRKRHTSGATTFYLQV